MKVLYANDGFEPALAIGRLIEWMGDAGRVEVTVLSVTPDWAPPYETARSSLELLQARREESTAIVEVAVEKLLAAGFKAVARTSEGYPAEEILRAVEKDGYDLIAMGAGNRSWLGSRLFGSVSTHVLHSSPRSVLVVHEAKSVGVPHALIGVDGSPACDLALDTFSGFADPARTKISVVSVAPPQTPTFFAVPGAVYVPPHSDRLSEEIRKQGFDRALHHADTSATKLMEAGFDVTTDVVHGNPIEQLLTKAKDGSFDMVVVGSRGLGPVRRALLGSVSDQLARHASATLVGRRLEG